MYCKNSVKCSFCKNGRSAFTPYPPPIGGNIHSRRHRIGGLDRLNMLSNDDDNYDFLNMGRQFYPKCLHCYGTKRINCGERVVSYFKYGYCDHCFIGMLEIFKKYSKDIGDK